MSSSFFSYPCRRAQGMSLNVIVVAVIVLVIMVVLIAVFGSKFRFFGSATVACENKGAGAQCCAKEGTGGTSCSARCGDDHLVHRGTDCERQTNAKETLCCVPFGGTPPKK